MRAERPWAGRRLHFIGVGGAGMSAYARAACALGAQVSGSDRADSEYLRQLREDRVLDASIGHSATNVPEGDRVEVVHSSAVPAENPERMVARQRGLTVLSRGELLGQLTTLRRTIAVAGTHGKTTTSSMIVYALRAAGLDPGWLIGAPVGDSLPNGYWTAGEWLVVEADESDRSMLELNVEIAVLTNVELDHHSAFSSLAQLRRDFSEFIDKADQAVVWNRPSLLKLRHGSLMAYDAKPELDPEGSTFHWHEQTVRLLVAGEHNAVNAAGALEAAVLAGAEPGAAIVGLGEFRGAHRRFQLLGKAAKGASVYDDYAHHPTEVAATLSAARTLRPRRLIAVFQPHLYSRTQLLASQFGQALAAADVIVVLDVYPAREQAVDYPGVSGLLLAQEAARHSDGRPVLWLADLPSAANTISGLLCDGDVCVVMGAGDVTNIAYELVAG